MSKVITLSTDRMGDDDPLLGAIDWSLAYTITHVADGRKPRSCAGTEERDLVEGQGRRGRGQKQNAAHTGGVRVKSRSELIWVDADATHLRACHRIGADLADEVVDSTVAHLLTDTVD